MAPLPPHPRLAQVWARGRAFLGSELAIMGGAMTWVSERRLVAALSNAGAFGVLACGSMSPEALAEEIDGTRQLTDRPFGVNLIVLHPELDELVRVCIDRRISHVVLAGAIPPRAAVAALAAAGIKVLAFAASATVARRLIRAGIDAVVVEGSEAGGHIGPVSTSVLAQEVLPEIREVPVFVAGGIGHGEAIAAFLSMGAAGVQMGTIFVCARESIVHPETKRAYIRATARDAVASVQLDPDFRVVPVRALRNQATERFLRFQQEMIARFRAGEVSYEEASLAIEHFWAGALRRAVLEGDVHNGSLMAGQSVGFVRAERPVAEILAELVEQAEAALARRSHMIAAEIGP